MEHELEAYRGKEVVVLGLAKSGQAVSRLFHKLGANVTVSDRKSKVECPEADELEQLGVRVICGEHPDGLIHEGVSLVVKNPGIPYDAAPVAKATQLGLEVVTEVEVAYFLCEKPIISVTGSNGKTTTVSWIGHMMKEAGLDPMLAGNIGKPLSEAVQETGDQDWIVLELSSFQLKGTRDFRPHIACLLNLYETHMDYHHSMLDYQLSKAKMFANQREQDVAVLNRDDHFCKSLGEQVRSRIVWFSSKSRPDGEAVYVDRSGPEPVLQYQSLRGAVTTIAPLSAFGIPGSHNVEDAMAASAVCLAAGVPIGAIAKGLQTFRGVEHRLEFVREWQGIAFYNDSKSTNPTSTCRALDAFTRPIVLIAGGMERGSDFSPLIPLMATKVKAVIAIGETGAKIADAASQAGLSEVKIVNTGKEDASGAMGEALRLAGRMTHSGDVVLLSPACASWDMFTSFEQRGRMFKDSVHNL